MTNFRDHTFLGTTQSLCPHCLDLVFAKIIKIENRIYFDKNCLKHGPRRDFVCSDAKWFDLTSYSLPGKIPHHFGTVPQRGCPYDCGLCDEHEQHTCLGLLEITSRCNLHCPVCFAESGPSGDHLSLEQCRTAINRLVEVEGKPEILQLSGGEPTIHPQFLEIFRYACQKPIDIVMINTNGVRIAQDTELVEQIAEFRHRCEIYLQFDGFTDRVYQSLRGASLVKTKLQAIDRLAEAGIHTTLVCTVQPEVNCDQLGPIVEFGTERPHITGVSFQPTTYCGRKVLPKDLEQRITFPDIIKGLCKQTKGTWQESDFSPLPCAHPNAHTLSYAIRDQGRVLPLARFLDLENHLDLLSGRITFDRQRARSLISEYLARQPCGMGGCNNANAYTMEIFRQMDLPLEQDERELAIHFLKRVLSENLQQQDMFRITTTSFMDAYNFDVRQLMKSCVHFILPSGHLIPFSAYNVLYRNGFVPLPVLKSPLLSN